VIGGVMKKFCIAMAFVCAAALCGCSEGERVSVTRDTADVGSETRPAITESTASAPEAPSNITVEYSKKDKAVKFSWPECDNAVKYEVNNGNVPKEFSKSEFYLNNVEEGMGGSYFIRSIAADGSTSEWVEAKYFIEVNLAAPDKVMQYVDGSRIYLYWNPVDGATSYEVNYYGDGNTASNLPISAPYTYFHDKVDSGVPKKFDIRSVKLVGTQQYYSDWATYTYTAPTFKALADYDYFESCTLSYEMLKKYATAQGHKLTTTKDGDYTNVVITMKDDANSGWKNRLKRAAAAAFRGAVEGYEQGIDDNMLDAAFECEEPWFKDYFDKLDEAATKDAKKNAIISGLRALVTDVNITCLYRYKNTATAPERCQIALVKKNRETFDKDFAAQHKPDANGIYTFQVEGSGQCYFVRIGQNTNYWIVDLIPQHAV